VAAGDVDDAQAPMAQVSEIVVIKPEIVGTAMPKGLGHTAEVQHAAGNGRRGDKSRHPAHLVSV
jgi:hypothetical protein